MNYITQDLQYHQHHKIPNAYISVVELGPSNLVSVWGEPNGSRVRQHLNNCLSNLSQCQISRLKHLFFINPVCDTIENDAWPSCLSHHHVQRLRSLPKKESLMVCPQLSFRWKETCSRCSPQTRRRWRLLLVPTWHTLQVVEGEPMRKQKGFF